MGAELKPVSTAVLLALLAAAWAIAADVARASQPDLLVSSYFSDNVLRYDGQTGVFIDVFASGGGLDRPAGLAFGLDNNLYVSSGTTDNVLRYDGQTGTFMDVFAVGGGLDIPAGLVFGPDDNLYVSSVSTDNVIRFDGHTGTFMDSFAAGGGPDWPSGLTFGPDANLYVSSSWTDSVLRYDGQTGDFIGVFASGGGAGLARRPAFRPGRQSVCQQYDRRRGPSLRRTDGGLHRRVRQRRGFEWSHFFDVHPRTDGVRDVGPRRATGDQTAMMGSLLLCDLGQRDALQLSPAVCWTCADANIFAYVFWRPYGTPIAGR